MTTIYDQWDNKGRHGKHTHTQLEWQLGIRIASKKNNKNVERLLAEVLQSSHARRYCALTVYQQLNDSRKKSNFNVERLSRRRNRRSRKKHTVKRTVEKQWLQFFSTSHFNNSRADSKNGSSLIIIWTCLLSGTVIAIHLFMHMKWKQKSACDFPPFVYGVDGEHWAITSQKYKICAIPNHFVEEKTQKLKLILKTKSNSNLRRQ